MQGKAQYKEQYRYLLFIFNTIVVPIKMERVSVYSYVSLDFAFGANLIEITSLNNDAKEKNIISFLLLVWCGWIEKHLFFTNL